MKKPNQPRGTGKKYAEEDSGPVSGRGGARRDQDEESKSGEIEEEETKAYNFYDNKD
jgi:hypothetical protein